MAVRTKGKLVRLTPEEFAEIERRAKAARSLPARYIRQAALSGGAPVADAGTTATAVYVLGQIGAELKALLPGVRDDDTRTLANRALQELLIVLQQLARGQRQ